jgi:hypothetical protein
MGLSFSEYPTSRKAEDVGAGITGRRGSLMGCSSALRSRFHPHVQSSGQIMIDGKVIDAKGEAMFVAAIQGLRPDAVSRKEPVDQLS